MSDAIAVEGLTKSYGRTRGVIELTFTVAPGEVFGYLGPNGAGKTTTIRTLLDFIRPTAGSATVLGLDSRRDSIEIHRRTGYLPGEFTLYENLTGGGVPANIWPPSVAVWTRHTSGRSPSASTSTSGCASARSPTATGRRSG